MKGKDKLKQEIADCKNSNNTVEEVADRFDEFMDSVSKKRNLKIIEELYRNVVSNFYRHTNTYKFLINEFRKTERKLLNTLDNTQKDLYERLDMIQNEITDDYAIQAFATAIMIVDVLKMDLDKFYNSNEILNKTVNFIKQIKKD